MVALESTIQRQSQIFLTASDYHSITFLICNFYQLLLRSGLDDRQLLVLL